MPEIPGAYNQGRTLEEAREIVKGAVRLLLEVRCEQPRYGRDRPGSLAQ